MGRARLACSSPPSTARPSCASEHQPPGNLRFKRRGANPRTDRHLPLEATSARSAPSWLLRARNSATKMDNSSANALRRPCQPSERTIRPTPMPALQPPDQLTRGPARHRVANSRCPQPAHKVRRGRITASDLASSPQRRPTIRLVTLPSPNAVPPRHGRSDRRQPVPQKTGGGRTRAVPEADLVKGVGRVRRAWQGSAAANPAAAVRPWGRQESTRAGSTSPDPQLHAQRQLAGGMVNQRG